MTGAVTAHEENQHKNTGLLKCKFHAIYVVLEAMESGKSVLVAPDEGRNLNR